MKKYLSAALLATLLGACGGGGSSPSPPPTETPNAAALLSTLCGVDVGDKLLQGTVTNVHDGDTVTLNVGGTSYNVRMDGLDAPELAQTLGSQSQAALSNAVLGKSVQVTYTKTDKYGRIVGAVFTEGCQYVNLAQVSAGMAWFYKAYQCELSAPVRSQFAQAQDTASAAKLGLWSQNSPTPPWVYRNGTDPKPPTCPSHAATIDPSELVPSGTPATPATPTPSMPVVTPTTTTPTTPTVVPATTTPSSTVPYTPVTGCSKVWVNGYTRSNGTRVAGYWRNSPGCA